jgi:hypothetical protein
MSSFIRKKKTKSGATAIQIIYKQGRIVTGKPFCREEMPEQRGRK